MPPTEQRDSARPVPTGPAKSPVAPPPDPRRESVPTGGSARKNGNAKNNGNARSNSNARSNGNAKNTPGRNSAQGSRGPGGTSQSSPTSPVGSKRRDGAPPVDVARASPSASPASDIVDEGVAGASTEVVISKDAPERDLKPVGPRSDGRNRSDQAEARVPLLLPPIVPAEPPPPSRMPVPTTPATVAVPLPGGALVEHTDTDGTDGLPSLLKPKRPQRALRAPVVRPRRAPRVRRVTRVVRHVDSWSIFKVALVFNLFLYGVCLTAGVLLWQVAQNTGTIDNVERFFESFGWEKFELKGGELYHNAWIAGLFVVVGLTGLAVLMATLFNLITDLVGGIRVTVLEEEVVAREDRGLGWRRGSRSSVTTAPVTAPEAEPVADQSQPG